MPQPGSLVPARPPNHCGAPHTGDAPRAVYQMKVSASSPWAGGRPGQAGFMGCTFRTKSGETSPADAK